MSFTRIDAGTQNWDVPLNDALEDLHAGGGANVNTQQDTASTTYTDLSTAGPSVTIILNEPRTVLVFLKSQMQNTSTADDVYMSFDAAGDTTFSASDTRAARHNGSGTAENSVSVAAVACNAGITTFTSKYRVDGGNGRFTNRVLAVSVVG